MYRIATSLFCVSYTPAPIPFALPYVQKNSQQENTIARRRRNLEGLLAGTLVGPYRAPWKEKPRCNRQRGVSERAVSMLSVWC